MAKGSFQTKTLKLVNMNQNVLLSFVLLMIFSVVTMNKNAFAGPHEIDKQYRQAKTLQEHIKIAENIKTILKKEPRHPALNWRLARSHYSIAKRIEKEESKNFHYTRCIEVSSHALKIQEDSAHSYFFRALCRGKQGEMKGVWASLDIIDPFEKDMKKALALDPGIENAGPHRALGKLYLELPFFLGGNNKQSVYHLEEAVRLSPHYAENHLGLAQAHYAQNNFSSARKSLLTLLSLTDNSANNESLASFRIKGLELMKKLPPQVSNIND